eukprot:TRINITY_DN234_c0_g1_i2.p1 TRINITY_DN234_c0_g1~~TRINITY_DN234_c0_g1_i2.p1  ORF type:complete len:783 (-),score=171.75 TRINITY_DN234_c0_g1_i2:67-2415(-)
MATVAGAPRVDKAKSVGPYILGKTLGQGSYGKVKLATHKDSKKNFAIKILSPSTSQQVCDIDREIRILSSLRGHPHIVHLQEVFVSNPHIYIVNELVDGGELFDHIVMRGKLSEREALPLFHQLASAMEFCHNSKIVHRDLKPENVLIDKDGRILKLNDFGLSAFINPSNEADADQLSFACGSPIYAAPEMVHSHRNKKPHDQAVDVWALGVTLYAMVTGRLPWVIAPSGNTISNMDDFVAARFSWPPGVSLSEPVKHLISSMLVADSTKRPLVSQVLGHPWLCQSPSIFPTRNAIDNSFVTTTPPITVIVPLPFGPSSMRQGLEPANQLAKSRMSPRRSKSVHDKVGGPLSAMRSPWLPSSSPKAMPTILEDEDPSSTDNSPRSTTSSGGHSVTPPDIFSLDGDDPSSDIPVYIPPPSIVVNGLSKRRWSIHGVPELTVPPSTTLAEEGEEDDGRVSPPQSPRMVPLMKGVVSSPELSFLSFYNADGINVDQDTGVSYLPSRVNKGDIQISIDSWMMSPFHDPSDTSLGAPSVVPPLSMTTIASSSDSPSTSTPTTSIPDLPLTSPLLPSMSSSVLSPRNSIDEMSVTIPQNSFISSKTANPSPPVPRREKKLEAEDKASYSRKDLLKDENALRSTKGVFTLGTTTTLPYHEIVEEITRVLVEANVDMILKGAVFKCKKVLGSEEMARRQQHLQQEEQDGAGGQPVSKPVPKLWWHQSPPTSPDPWNPLPGENEAGVIKFEIEICKITGLDVRGVKLKRLYGDMWRYRDFTTTLVANMKLV